MSCLDQVLEKIGSRQRLILREYNREGKTMAGGVTETDPEKLANHCEHFMEGAKKKYDSEEHADMWFFELYHHLDDCATALRAANKA